MAAKKKIKKRQTKSKRTVGNKMRPLKKTAKKKLTKKKAAQKKTPVRKEAVGKKTIGAKTLSVFKKQVREKSRSVETVAFSPEDPPARSGRQSGDLQGASSVKGSDSESVDELLEEGNAFEAGVVTGVEDAGNADEKEVRTHEVPQDDVPGEYQDKE
jgi:hypothetical protein